MNMAWISTGLLRATRAHSTRAGVMVQQRATYIHGKPPKHSVGPAESAFVLIVMSLTILGPSGWILANLDHYKARN